MTPLQLTMSQVLVSGRQHYVDHLLQPQVTPGRNGCFYDGPCVVGSAVNPNQRASLDKTPPYSDTDVATLVNKGLIEVPFDQLRDMAGLQQTHDTWASSPATPATFEADFLIRLRELERKYSTHAGPLSTAELYGHQLYLEDREEKGITADWIGLLPELKDIWVRKALAA